MKKFIRKIFSIVKENWKSYMNGFKELFNDIRHKNTFYKQVPNLLTISRAVGMIPVNVLFFTGNMLLGTILLGILLSTDFFDGKIARKYGLVSKFGADLDAICDKIMSFGLLLPLVMNNVIIIANLLLECVIAIINTISKLKGRDVKTMFSGKIKTWILSFNIGFGYLSKFNPFLNNIFILFSILTIPAQIKTIYDYISYVSSNESKMKNEKKNNDISITRELSIQEKKVNLEKEKEFLLSTNVKKENDIKTKKRKK